MAGVKPYTPPASASWVLGLQACTAMILVCLAVGDRCWECGRITLWRALGGVDEVILGFNSESHLEICDGENRIPLLYPPPPQLPDGWVGAWLRDAFHLFILYYFIFVGIQQGWGGASEEHTSKADRMSVHGGSCQPSFPENGNTRAAAAKGSLPEHSKRPRSPSLLAHTALLLRTPSSHRMLPVQRAPT